VDVCSLEELPPGSVRIVRDGDLAVGVFNAGGELYALEDR
jgi:nitrite reductase/ring-hydroxylating ferredoxin subunit